MHKNWNVLCQIQNPYTGYKNVTGLYDADEVLKRKKISRILRPRLKKKDWENHLIHLTSKSENKSASADINYKNGPISESEN